jgi:hypothetical protein
VPDPSPPDALLPHVAPCRDLLDQAVHRIREAQFGAGLDALVERACAMLDALDVVLLRLHPIRDATAFATAAGLHRRLERIQDAIPPSARRRPPAATYDDDRSSRPAA